MSFPNMGCGCDGSEKKACLLLVDDHVVVREGLAALIKQQPDLTVCCAAENAEQALKSLKKSQPALALIDISLPGMDGIELIKEIHQLYPELPMLALSMMDEKLYAERVLRAGGKGYVMKQEATEKVLLAIRKVLKGEVFVSEGILKSLLDKIAGQGITSTKSSVERLSDRELNVFQLIGRGLTTRRIAEEIHISVKTVETYRAHIKEKLNLKSGAELTQHAMNWLAQEQQASSKPSAP